MRAVPLIAAGVTITPLQTPQGLRYRLAPRGRGGGTVVPPRTLVALMLMDGRRTLAEVQRDLDEHGVRIPDPAKLMAMVRVFESAGVVELRHRYETPGPLRHICEGCGQSCEGHLVGPIENAEATELEARLIELRGTHGDIAPGPATVQVEYEGQTHRVLHFPGGSCIFLDAEKRCRLHATWGPNSKPLPCRMFPIRMVRTETGSRVAVSPRCFRAHHSYRTAPPSEVDELMDAWGVWRPPALVQGLDPAHSESLALTPAAQANLAAEKLVLARLEAGERDLAWLLARLAPGGAGPPAPSEAARRALGAAALDAIQGALRDRFVVPDEARPATTFGGNVAAFVTDVPALPAAAAGLAPWWDLPDAALDYVLHGLRHLVFSREVMAFGGVPAGTLVYVMGVMVARWLSDVRDLRAGRLDAFVTRLTVWVRLAGAREFQAVLFPRPGGAERLLERLAEDGADG